MQKGMILWLEKIIKEGIYETEKTREQTDAICTVTWMR